MIILVITLIGIFPLFHVGLPPTHDGEYHVVRFSQFYKAFIHGDIYPRWAMDFNNGYGLPLFNYVYPFPNYISVVLHTIGLSFIDSFKANLIIATLLGAIFFYFWTRFFWGNLGGMLSAISYSFVPYRFVDIYVRGSVGEIWALCFLPAYLWGMTIAINKRSFSYALVSGVFLSLIIFSHNILALMLIVFSLLYSIFTIICYSYREKPIKYLFFSLFIGLSLSSIFWLPALTETKFVRGLEIYSIKDNFPGLDQLLIPSWGTGFSGGELQNQMSFQIGIVPLMVIILCLFGLMFKKFRKLEYINVLFFLILFFCSIFLMLKVSLPIWENVPLVSYFQFPWRFLSITIICTSFLAGAILKIFPTKLHIFIVGAMLTLNIFATLQYTKPAYYLNRSDSYYLERPNFIDGTNSPGNLFNTVWMRGNKKMKNKIIAEEGIADVSKIEEKTSYRKYLVSADREVWATADIAYFPGWKIFQDGIEKESNKTNEGLLIFPVDKGKHIIEIKFTDTMVRYISRVWFVLSGLIFISLILYLVNNSKKHEHRN